MGGDLSILHISDFHFSKDFGVDQESLVTALLQDVELLGTKYQKPDCIVFSGDLVNNPDELESYYGSLDLLSRLTTITGVALDRVIICPGNHDVSRAVINARKPEHDSLIANARDQDYIEHLYGNGRLNSYAAELTKDFFITSEILERKWSDPFCCAASIPMLKLSVLIINSTLCCTTEGSEKDLGNLAIPVTALEKTLARVPADHLVLTVCHHPMAHLTESTARRLKTLLSRRSRAHFSGHLHDAVPEFVISANGETVYLQSGALYTKASSFLGYSMLRITKQGEHPQLLLRTYMRNRGVFDAAADVCAAGIFCPTQAAQAYWASQLPVLDESELANWLRDRAYKEIKAANDFSFGAMPLEDVFVFPPLAKSTKRSDPKPEELQNSEEMVDLTDVLTSNDNFLVLVPDESGATSLLSFLALQQCQGAIAKINRRVPLLIDIRGVRAYPGHALRALRQAHPEADHDRFGWRSLASLQPYLVLVDNFDPRDPIHVSALSFLHGQVPSAKFVVAAKTDLTTPDKIKIDFKLPFSYTTLKLLPFTRRKVRQLVHNWALPASFSENYVVDEILNRFRALSIPLVGPHIAMFLMVLAQQKKFSPVNNSTIIENFVEQLLDKPAPGKIFRRELDFKEKAEILSLLAEHLVRTNTSFIDSIELMTLFRNHYDRIGIRRNITELVETLKTENALVEFDGNVAFRYNVLFSYFVAYRMIGSEQFRGYVLDFDRFTSFVHEIDLYCGLTRHDLSVLEVISTHYKRITEEAPSELKAIADYVALERLVLPHVKDFEEFVSKFSEAVVEEVPQETRDKIFDRPILSAKEFRQNFARHNVQNGLVKWLFALRAYSVCLKNLESIAKEDKVRHLKLVLDGWAKLVGFGVTITGMCLEDRTIEVAGTKFTFEGFERLDGQMMRALLTHIPSFVANYMRMDLATEKLELQLKHDEFENPAMIDLLRTGMLAYLKLPGFLDSVRSYFDKSAKSLFLKEAMGWKLREVYLRYGFSDSEGAEFRRIIAEVDADLRGLRGLTRERHVQKFLQSLEKGKLLGEMKT